MRCAHPVLPFHCKGKASRPSGSSLRCRFDHPHAGVRGRGGAAVARARGSGRTFPRRGRRPLPGAGSRHRSRDRNGQRADRGPPPWRRSPSPSSAPRPRPRRRIGPVDGISTRDRAARGVTFTFARRGPSLPRARTDGALEPAGRRARGSVRLRNRAVRAPYSHGAVYCHGRCFGCRVFPR